MRHFQGSSFFRPWRRACSSTMVQAPKQAGFFYSLLFSLLAVDSCLSEGRISGFRGRHNNALGLQRRFHAKFTLYLKMNREKEGLGLLSCCFVLVRDE